jgi:hypothetical protein
LDVASGSAITRLDSLEVASGSAITRISALETASGSAITRLSSIESKTGSYATTGSNTFVDGQYLSSSFNPTGFSTTASLYTDGGLRVTRDAYISGTLYLNNVTVFGTQSVAYISSSQLNIGTNLITVNTDTPSIRFGGLAVYDSGSTGLTGSILWDSQNNHWVYSNPSGSSYSGGMFISGPRTSTLGSETGTTSCMLMAGQGGDHITSSMIYHSSTVTCIPNTLLGGAACFSNTVCVGTNLIVRSAATFCDTLGLFGGSSQLYIGATSNASDFAVLGWCSTNRSLNIQNQSTGNSPQLIIACDGKVGVAVRDPMVQFHVRTNVASESRPTNLATSATNSAVYFTTIGGSSAGIAFGQLGANTSYIQTTYENGAACTPLALNPYQGGVGIGTGNNAFSGQRLFIQSANDQAGITMYNSYECNMWALATGTSGINNKGFAIRDEINNATRLQIDNSGNIGIGTLSPGGRLDVVTCSNTTQNFYLRNTDNTNASSRAYFNIIAGNTSLSLLALAGGGSPGGTYIAGTTGADMYFQQSPGSTVNMIIKPDGKVGIGTISPAGFLEIKCAQTTYHRIVSCFEGSYTSGFAFSDLLGGLKYDAGGNTFCIYSNYANYGGIIISTATSPRMLIHSCGGVNIASGNNFVSVQRHNFEVGDIKLGGGFALCTINIPQETWSTFACVVDGDTNVVVDFTYVNSNDFNRSGAILSRWAYNAGCAALYIVNCAYNWSQNIGVLDFRNNSGALQVCVAGGGGTYKVQARIQGSRATG